MIPADIMLDAYSKMLTIRFAEERITKDFLERKIFSFYHSSVGQEAVAVGVCAALKPEDRVFGNHRSHGHYLAKGGDLYAMFCEIYGKADGCCKGKGGSMHMLDRSVGFMGSTPILGSAVSIATGSAFEQKLTNSNNITVAFTGDGASEEGVVYESINLAAAKKLPLVIVIEDNMYAVNTPLHDRRSRDFESRKTYSGLGAEVRICNGNDFVKTYEAMIDARFFAANGTPTVLIALTFRHMAHSGPIKDESVRLIDKEAERVKYDCIARMESDLIDNQIADEKSIAELRAAEFADVEKAWQMAQDCATAPAELAKEGVYAGDRI